MRKAQSLASGATDKEKGLIEAVAKRYAENPPEDRKPLDAAFADAMVALADKYPDDLELATIAAEAGMDTQPWDYWEPGGHEPKGRGADIQKRLEAVLAKKPDHPWAMHLYIHFVEASDRPERGEPYADRLAALMPGAGHIVHMPSHIYFRVGRYTDLLASNVAASKVDEDYIAKTGAMGVYPIAYYSHNVHFVLVSAALLGDKPTVLSQAEKLDKWLTNDVAAQIPFVQPVKAAPYFAWAQYGEPDMVLALPDPPGAPPYVKAMWHYARGAAFAAKKDPAAARKEAEAIQAIVKNTDWSVLTLWGIPAEPVLNVAAEVVLARAAQAENNQEAAIASSEESRRNAGHHSLYGAPLLVLSGAAIAGRRAHHDRKTGRGAEGVRGRTRARTQQRLGALRRQGSRQGEGRRGCRTEGRRRSCESVEGRSCHADPGAAVAAQPAAGKSKATLFARPFAFVPTTGGRGKSL